MQFPHIILHLSLIRGLSPVIVDCLMRHAMLSAEIYQYTVADMQRIFAISENAAQKVVIGLQDCSYLDRELNLLTQHNISWLSWQDAQYSKLLSHIHLPPPILYWQGTLHDASRAALAIVGARKADGYAKRVIEGLVPELVAHNFSIISGGAMGADAFAHHAAVQVNGYTIAVLGSGLLRKYPSQNFALFDRIIDAGGAVLSSFGLEMEPLAHNFPIRNRIIAGLSHGCLVVQAAEQSGASITAGLALDQGKEVFAVPGLVDNPLSAGCHKLIQQGAKLVTNAADIITEFGIMPSQKVIPLDYTQNPQGNVPAVGDIPKRSLTPEKVSEWLQKKGYKLIEQQLALACVNPQSVDELVTGTGLTVVQLQNILFSLQMDDVLHQDTQGLWRLNHNFFA